MSPRRTELLHELCDGEHLGTVGFVRLQHGHFLCQDLPALEPIGSLDQRRPDGPGSAHAGGLQSAEGSEGFIVQSN